MMTNQHDQHQQTAVPLQFRRLKVFQMYHLHSTTPQYTQKDSVASVLWGRWLSRCVPNRNIDVAGFLNECVATAWTIALKAQETTKIFHCARLVVAKPSPWWCSVGYRLCNARGVVTKGAHTMNRAEMRHTPTQPGCMAPFPSSRTAHLFFPKLKWTSLQPMPPSVASRGGPPRPVR